MRKIFIMLLIAITAVATTNAQTSKKSQTNKPVNVIKQLNFTIDTYGQKDKQSYSVKRNPNTNLIESSEKIVPFFFKNTNVNQQLNILRDAFTKDEHVSYQFKHIAPGINDVFSLNVLSENGKESHQEILRSNDDEEMWLLCCKNTENPQLRDAYAVTWIDSKEEGTVKGYIYMITSLRPDIYQQRLEETKKTFKIEGRVDTDIKDSLYNIYIADSYDELNSLGDNDHVACVPVINKRFEYSVELDKPKAGRIRAIFPDKSLCTAWIDLDMVPGETYRITVHNGYFDEDKEYERRVGRNSGKSLIVGQRNKNDNLPKLTEAQEFSLMRQALVIENRIKTIKSLLEYIVQQMKQSTLPGNKVAKDINGTFKTINEQNILLDENCTKVIATAKQLEIPHNEVLGLYKKIIEFFTKQSKYINDIYAVPITLYPKVAKYQKSINKEAAKCQTNVNKLTEKYLDEITHFMEK